MDRIKENTKLFIVVPCYNESEALPHSAKRLVSKLAQLRDEKHLCGPGSKIVFVNDGSKDDTWDIITRLHKENPVICGLDLAHNRGHQNALLAGLMFSKEHADVSISIDADLQQDIDAMELFLEEYYKGNEIVYGVRNSRDTDSAFKKSTAGIFYGLMGAMGVELYPNSADYRLLSKKALTALSEYDEVNLFLRGLLPDIGLKSSVVHFDVFEREYGQSKYTLKKMMNLAMSGITSFSTTPIHIISGIGITFILLSIAMIIYVLIDYFHGNNVAGYSTILISLWFIGGMVMFSLGVVGEYVGLTYIESKKRPRYFLADIYYKEEDNH